MNIVSWNWHYDSNIEKYFEILKYNPQILTIQECKKQEFDCIKNKWVHKNWYNDDLNREKSDLGVAIFSNEYKIEFTDIFNRKYRYFIPYVISKDKYQFILFSVWIKPVGNNYEKHLDDAIEYYRGKNLLDDNSIVIGDFNTFAKTENERLKSLEDKLNPMINCTKDTPFYKAATYYDAKYGYGTDDFCFVSEDIKNKYKIDINIPAKWDEGKDKEHHWNGLSDHSPIIINIELK
jgi:exonuclease III